MARLLPEWSPQWGVMIAWPHQDTDWAPILAAAERTYLALATAILEREHLLVLCRDEDHRAHIHDLVRSAGAATERLVFRVCPYNDTWTRDYGPLTVADNRGEPGLLDFSFNGWGGKFPAHDDDAVNGRIAWSRPVTRVPVFLEGGSVEIDEEGRLLTTSTCLLNPNRNPELDRADVEALLRERLGASDVLWLENGHLEGDDTDAHIDTLARLCPNGVIAYVQCQDENDSHYNALREMEEELRKRADRHGLRLVPLPMAEARFDDDGHRLPATYANFLVINGAVLVPTYDSERDSDALARVAEAFPGHEIVGVPCLPLIHQHGSLHCVTMQLPEGVFPVPAAEGE